MRPFYAWIYLCRKTLLLSPLKPEFKAESGLVDGPFRADLSFVRLFFQILF